MFHSEVAKYLFAPSSIALVGASADESKHASLPQRHLRRHGFRGSIYPVNLTRSEIFGERAYKSVRDIGQPIDHAFIMVPTGAVYDAVADCGAAGVRCATVFSNGFAETGVAGRALQEKLLRKADELGMRILGPNSLGVVNPRDGVALSASEMLSLPELKRGSLGLISQSGSIIGTLLSRAQARGLGFSRMVSLGNEADLGMAEIGEMLIDDPETEVILLFVETIRDAAGIRRMAQRAYVEGKPVVAFRLGRSTVGARLAESHTGALAGDGEATDAFLRDIGVVCIDLLDTLFQLPPLLVGRRPRGGRRRVVTASTTGGGGGLVVDRLALLPDVEVVGPSAETISRLKDKGITIPPAPLIDLTLAGANAKTYGTVMDELLASPDVDFVLSVVGSSAQFRPDRAIDPSIGAFKRHPEKPAAVFLTPQADEAFAKLVQNGVAAFLTAECCADGVQAFLNWRKPRSAAAVSPDLQRAQSALSSAKDRKLDAVESRYVFEALGIHQAIELVLAPDEKLDEGRSTSVRFPVVVKVLSRDIPHKTEAGGVVAGVRSVEELDAACISIAKEVAKRRPDAIIQGFQVQSMEKGLTETLVGFRRDPQVGPTVTVGLGGTLTELYRDFAIRMAPVDFPTAMEMLEEVRGLAVIRGYRSLPRGDLKALARAIEAASWLALIKSPLILEAEINPLIVKADGDGVVAVDGLIVCE